MDGHADKQGWQKGENISLQEGHKKLQAAQSRRAKNARRNNDKTSDFYYNKWIEIE